MKDGMRVQAEPDIRSALALIEKDLSGKVRHPESMSLCLLLCEELLLHLLKSGFEEISLTASVTPGKRPLVKISAPGDADPLFTRREEARPKELQEQISQNILRQYSSFIDYRQKKGVNTYVIRPAADQVALLTREILSYYQDGDAKKAKSPKGLLLFLAKKHPAMAAASVMLRAIRHLGALMLTVFTANIIQALVDYQTFFCMPVYLNLFGSALALADNLIFAWLENEIYQRFIRYLETALKVALVDKLEMLSYHYHSETPSGKLLGKVVSDVTFVKMLLYDHLEVLVFLPEDILFVVVMALFRLPFMLIIYAVLFIAAFFLIRRFTLPVWSSKTEMRRRTEYANGLIQEMLSMDKTIRSQGMQTIESTRIRRALALVQAEALHQDRLQVYLNNVGYGASQSFRLIVLSVAGILCTRGAIEVGTVILFSSLLETLLNSMQRSLDLAPMVTQGLDSLNSIHELFSETDLEKNGQGHLKAPVRGEIAFRDLIFRYLPEEEPVLKGISLEIPAGKCAAIVGRSGGGKSTILNLLLGLYSWESGTITIDGQDLKDLDKNSYRRYIAVVPQDPALFAGTLWDNLTFGLLSCSSARVMDVLEQVGLTGLVKEQEAGLNMEITEGGMNLSGGQRQRLSIARALLRRPRIILLDEATSALDTESEKQVQEAIEAAMGTCTMVIVAHRLNTVRKADLIYELSEGKLSLCDSYEALLQERSKQLASEEEQAKLIP